MHQVEHPMRDAAPFSPSASPFDSRAEKPWYLDGTAWTVALSFTGYPLVGLVASYLSIPDNSLSIMFRVLAAAFTTVVFCSNAARYGVKLPYVGLVVFMILYAFRLAWDTGRADQPDAEECLVIYVALVAIPVVAVVAPLTPWPLSNVISCCFWLSSICCGLALLLDLRGFALDPNESMNRLTFERVNPISLGYTASFSLISVLLGQAYWPPRWKATSLLAVPIAGLTLFLCASRGPLLAMAVTTALYCVAKRYWLFLLVLAAAALALVVATPSVDGESVFERLRLLSLPTDETVVQRLGLGELAWQEFLQNPMFGSGFSLPVTGQYPHNIVLETGMAMGVFGLALFLFLIAAGLWRALLAMTGNGDEFMASLFIYDLVASQFSGALWSQTVLFVAMGRLLTHPAAHLATNYQVGERRRTFVPLGNSYTVD